MSPPLPSDVGEVDRTDVPTGGVDLRAGGVEALRLAEVPAPQTRSDGVG